MSLVEIAREFGIYAVAIIILALVVRYLYNENKKMVEEQRKESAKLLAEQREDSLNREKQLQSFLTNAQEQSKELAKALPEINNKLDTLLSNCHRK